MIATAKDESDLRKRVKRFFDREHKRSRELSGLLDALSSRCEIYLFGGILRDIALSGIASFNSDIDIVYVGEADSVKDVIDARISTRNRFGGTRFRCANWEIDIWDARSSWAFASGHKTYQSIDSLLDTTITNWESILMNWRTKQFIYRDGYFQDLEQRYLDVVLTENPNKLGMFVKVLRCYASKEARELSMRAAEVVKGALDEFSFDEIMKYESRAYRDVYLTERILCYLKTHPRIRRPDLVPVRLDRQSDTLPLI